VNLSISPAKLSGLNSIVARANAVEGAEQITAEAYLMARVDEILASYAESEIERTMAENEAFFMAAARLPAEVQQQLRDLIASAEAAA
jgi:hypothetical protein